MPSLRDIARSLRRHATEAERRLWSQLRRNSVEGHYFRRQSPLLGYVVDFACFEAMLVVEVDGATHSGAEEIDTRRDRLLQTNGFEVLRDTNDDDSSEAA